MTGTAREVAAELWDGLRAGRGARAAPTGPVRRSALPDRMFARAADRWSASCGECADVHRTGRPVLIGTRSVAASEQLVELLEAPDFVISC